MTIRFDAALHDVLEFVRDRRQLELASAGKIVVLRDLYGRLHLATENTLSGGTDETILNGIRPIAGAFLTNSVLSLAGMMAPQAVFESQDLLPVGDDIWLLERGVLGAEWGRPILANEPPSPPRATLYGIKGGVGRSTALCVWARHLAERGETVLVVDLDLEAPGVSSMLLPLDAKPDFGVVDWFVEDAVGNADDDLVRQMTSPSHLAEGTAGKIVVAPCVGSTGSDYIAKLARAYIDVKKDGKLNTVAERVGSMIDHLERLVEPTIVLVDSRSGIHDLAGIATTRLGATTFLFAAGSRQTWDAYRLLLRSWARHKQVALTLREQLQVVAAQVPETGRDTYLAEFRQQAYDLFSETVYEEAAPDNDEAFNFDIAAEEAPHFPLPVYWSRIMQGWDPTRDDVPRQQVEALYGDFLKRATDLVLGEP